jgi:hypothetical protein
MLLRRSGGIQLPARQFYTEGDLYSIILLKAGPTRPAEEHAI